MRSGVKTASLQRKKPQKAMSAIWMENTAKTTFTSPLKKRPLPLAPEFIRTVAAVYEDECAREDFLDKAQALPEYLALTEDQKKQLLHNADIKGRISHYLDLCDTYWECYWDAVSKAAQDILQDDQQASPQK